MFHSATTAGPDLLPSPQRSGRIAPGSGLYRAITLVTVFAMLFGGLLLMTPMETSAASATSTARLNLRSGPSTEFDILTVIPDGAQVTVDGEVDSGYYPVTYNSTTGYALASFIEIGGTPDPGSGGEDVSGGAPTGTAWVDVARLNFRSAPTTSSGVISVLTDGTAVELTGQQSAGFWQAIAGGATGWLFADYLTTSGAPTTPDPDPEPAPGDDGSDDTSDDGASVPVGGNVTGSATVTANLNLRLGPGTTFAVVTVLRSGTTVELRGAADGDFYPVAQNGTTGWAHGGWLNIGSGAPDPTPEPTPDPAPGDDGQVGVGDEVTGSGTTTANLYMRSGPSSSYGIVTLIPSGATIELRGAAQGDFLPVAYNGMSGWSHGNWISQGSAAPDPTPEPTPEPTPDPAPGDDGQVGVGDEVTGTATVTANLNMRSGPGTEYGVVTVLLSGTTVEIRGAAQGEYYPVAQNGVTGWSHGNWLSIGGAPSEPDPTPEPTPDPGDGDSGVGDEVTGMATTTANLNLRDEPRPYSNILLVIPQGASIEIRGALNNGYYPVAYNGTAGWAASGWIQPVDGAPDAGDGDTPQYLYTSVAQNMRAQPTTDSASVWMIPPGTRVTVTGAPRNGWYPTRWAHVSGWMLGDYLLESYTRPVPEEDQWIVDIIYAAADRYGQPREDMLRVAQCESHLDPNVVNPLSGTSGLFQFRPSTWATTPYADQDIFDPVANANAAAWMWSVGRRNEWACQ